jgi:hypothetical protein
MGNVFEYGFVAESIEEGWWMLDDYRTEPKDWEEI